MTEIEEIFRTINLEGDWYGVFIVSPLDPKDRYLVTSTFNKQSEADHFTSEFNRIYSLWVGD